MMILSRLAHIVSSLKCELVLFWYHLKRTFEKDLAIRFRKFALSVYSISYKNSLRSSIAVIYLCWFQPYISEEILNLYLIWSC